MNIDIESGVYAEPMASMRVQVVATDYACSTNGMPYLTNQSTSYKSFCAQVDSLISQLERLKPKAKAKFAEFDRNSI
ncbi:MAG: hypothetical protein ABSA83_19055 [Verrucomicrobiota bacterium]|jgi:hypothetical protein